MRCKGAGADAEEFAMAVTLVSGLDSMSRAARMISGVITMGRSPTRAAHVLALLH